MAAGDISSQNGEGMKVKISKEEINSTTVSNDLDVHTNSFLYLFCHGHALEGIGLFSEYQRPYAFEAIHYMYRD